MKIEEGKRICITECKNTTLGKIYQTMKYEDSYGDIGLYYIDDLGGERIVCCDTFRKLITLDEFRNNKINKILE